MPNSHMRFKPYIDRINAGVGVFVEIGSGPYSTEWLSRTFRNFISIDPVDRYATIRTTAEDFFLKFDGIVSAAYLDGYDWGWEHLPIEARVHNDDSQQSHLIIANEVLKRASDRCVIVIDDTYEVEENDDIHIGCDGWSGKGGLAVPFLIDDGGFVVSDSCGIRKKMREPGYYDQDAWVVMERV